MTEDRKAKLIPLPKYREKTVLVDGDGEIQYIIARRNRNNLGKGWTALFQDGMKWIRQQNLTGEQWDVLSYFFEIMDYNNWARVKRAEGAKEVGISGPHFSRAVRKLIESDIIQEGPTVGRNKTYRLNPRIAHKGRNLKQTIVEYDDLRKRREARKQEQGSEE